MPFALACPFYSLDFLIVVPLQKGRPSGDRIFGPAEEKNLHLLRAVTKKPLCTLPFFL